MGLWSCRKQAVRDEGGVELGPPTSPAEREPLKESVGKASRDAGRQCAKRFLRSLESLGLSVRSHGGLDWIFLFLLGIFMATISFGLDLTVSKFQQVNLWVYDELVDNRCLQYFSWSLYHVTLMMVSAAAAKYVSPQAAGSGIPELKVALRGLVLHEFFTFRTLVAKLVGVICTLAGGSTIFLGKVGPFVHMATILATLLGKVMVTFAGSAENPGRKYELLIAGAAVGVACCFVAPVGGVLFGVEVTGTHFAVRNYWRGFFAATCAALTFRLLAVLNGARETVAVLFRTSWRVEFPYDLPELLSYALLGVLCGGICCVFLFCHRNILLFLRNWPRVNRFVVNNKIFYAGFISLLLASITFPHGLGQYMGARLSMKELLETFFNNMTWGLEEASVGNATRQPPNPTHDFSWLQWTHPAVSSLEMVSFFLIAKFFMLLLATTMTLPAGYFLPVFVYGAGLGRLYGEVMARIFPAGLISEGIHIRITPAGYALAGAAAYSGAITQTISTALLTFELTGQMSHILPVLVTVLVANAISQSSQPSFFDSIILVKKLPFLPRLSVAKSGGHDIYAEDFMVTNLKYLSRESKYKDLWDLLKVSNLKQFPLVDSQASRILLGSIKRKPLSRLLSDHLSAEKRFEDMLSQLDKMPKSQEQDSCGDGRKMEKSDAETSEAAAERSSPDTQQGHLAAAEEEEEEVRGEEEEEEEGDGPVGAASGPAPAGGAHSHSGRLLGRVRAGLASSSPCFQPLQTQTAVPGGGAHLAPQVDRVPYCSRVEEWQCQQLQKPLCLDDLPIDPAPYRLLEKETLHQCYELFSLLSLHTVYVTRTGRLVGVVGLRELKTAVEGCVKGTFPSRAPQHLCEPKDQEVRPPEKASINSSAT